MEVTAESMQDVPVTAARPDLAYVDDPLLRMVTQDLGGSVTAVVASAQPGVPQPVVDVPAPTRVILPPPRKVKRRHVNLLDAPVDEPLSTLDMLAGRIVNPRLTPKPSLPLTPPAETVQLSLF